MKVLFTPRVWAWLLACALLYVSCQNPQPPAVERLTGPIGKNGMVASAHPLASQVGVEILKKGGNAFDAAIAVQFALAVVYPVAGNIGGGGLMVYRKADGTTGTLDFREKAPLAAGRDMYLDDKGEVIKDLSTKGHLAVGVPGSVDGMVKMYEKFGSLSWEELLQPSIDLAANGFLLTQREAESLNRNRAVFLEVNPDTPSVVLPEGQEWHEGDTIYYRDLAKTLERIRDQKREGFYAGETAELLVKEMQRGKGVITLEDLAQYESKWRDPLVGEYKGYKVIAMPPPSSGGVALLQLLKGSEMYDLKGWGHNSPQTVHVMVELERRVYADRATHLGDADFYNVPIKALLDPVYLKERFSNIDLAKKTPSEEVKAGEGLVAESMETTHFSVVDKEGNAVSVTTTLNGGFGSKVFVAGGGFFLNNEMDDFSIKPGVPNMFGLVGGEANAIAPGKRMLSSMTPTIIEKDGKLHMVVGTPGGSTIITSVYQTILNVLEHGMTMQEAVNAKKFHSQWLPDVVMVEPDALDTVKLKALGHQIRPVPSLGRMDCILVLPDGSYEGGSDNTRADNTAVGY